MEAENESNPPQKMCGYRRKSGDVMRERADRLERQARQWRSLAKVADNIHEVIADGQMQHRVDEFLWELASHYKEW